MFDRTTSWIVAIVISLMILAGGLSSLQNLFASRRSPQSPKATSASSNQETTTDVDGYRQDTVTRESPKNEEANLLTNGDFSEDWPIGWTKWIDDDSTEANHVTVQRGEENTLYLHHEGEGFLAIYQNVPVDNLNLSFEVEAKLEGKEETGISLGHFGTAELQVTYRLAGDGNDNVLGASRWYHGRDWLASSGLVGTRESPKNSSTNHYIPVEEVGWKKYSIPNIGKELRDFLPGVDPAQVKVICIGFMVYGYAENVSADLGVRNVKLQPL